MAKYTLDAEDQRLLTFGPGELFVGWDRPALYTVLSGPDADGSQPGRGNRKKKCLLAFLDVLYWG